MYASERAPMCLCVSADAAGLRASGQLRALAGDAWRNQSSNNERNQPLTW